VPVAGARVANCRPEGKDLPRRVPFTGRVDGLGPPNRPARFSRLFVPVGPMPKNAQLEICRGGRVTRRVTLADRLHRCRRFDGHWVSEWRDERMYEVRQIPFHATVGKLIAQLTRATRSAPSVTAVMARRSASVSPPALDYGPRALRRSGSAGRLQLRAGIHIGPFADRRRRCPLAELFNFRRPCRRGDQRRGDMAERTGPRADIERPRRSPPRRSPMGGGTEKVELKGVCRRVYALVVGSRLNTAWRQRPPGIAPARCAPGRGGIAAARASSAVGGIGEPVAGCFVLLVPLKFPHISLAIAALSFTVSAAGGPRLGGPHIRAPG